MRAVLAIIALASLAKVQATGETKQIAEGVFMPVVNLGHPDDQSSEVGEAALWLKLGGTGLDTAYDYNNQKDVGKAVRESGLNRTDVFITTKISHACTEEKAVQAIKEDLNELQMDYVDLVLIHFPCPLKMQTKSAWKGLQSALKLGLARSIGVSNFNKADLEAVMTVGGVPPAINQCQMSIGSHDDETIAFCKSLNVTYEAYSPLRRVDLSNKDITAIAGKHSVTAAQVALRWISQQEILVATSTGTNEQYVKEDLDLFSFTLTDDEMTTLSAI